MSLDASSLGRVQGPLLDLAEISNQLFPHSSVHPQ